MTFLYTPTKGFFESKLNWLGILTFLAGLTDVAANGIFGFQVPAQWLPWIAVVSGFAAVILRTFFTDTRIGS